MPEHIKLARKLMEQRFPFVVELQDGEENYVLFAGVSPDEYKQRREKNIGTVTVKGGMIERVKVRGLTLESYGTEIPAEVVVKMLLGNKNKEE